MSDSSLQTPQDILNNIILGIAHELNNPNTFIRVNAINLKKIISLLRPHLSQLSQGNPGLKIGPYEVEEATLKMVQLADAILDASVRLIGIADKLKACTSFTLQEKTTVSLIEIIQSLIENHQFLIEPVGKISFVFDKGKTFEIMGHALELDQAFSILLVNAVDALKVPPDCVDTIKTDGHIEIKLDLQADHFINISLSDNGCGIPPEIIDKIFTPYFSTKPQGHGEGIGLALAKAIIERHGGNMSVTSTVGKGSCFCIHLPGLTKEK